MSEVVGFRGEHLHGLLWSLRMHLNMGRRHAYEHAAVEFPDLIVSKVSERGQVVEKHLYVGDREVPWGDLDQAARLLMEARGRPDEADEPAPGDDDV